MRYKKNMMNPFWFIMFFLFVFICLIFYGIFSLLTGGEAFKTETRIDSGSVWKQKDVDTFSLPVGSVEEEVRFIDFDKDSFRRGVQNAETYAYKSKALQVCGGFVPHHTLASPMIAGFLKSVLEKQKPEIVVLVGPNHPETIKKKFITGNGTWIFDGGMVKTDQDYVGFLEKNAQVFFDFSVFKTEHSIYELVPYVHAYAPHAKIVPLILTRDVSLDEVNRFLNLILKYAEDNNSSVVFVGSVDFSHYLTSFEARKNDSITEELIKNKKYDSLISLSNDYVDSPGTVALLTKLFDRLGCEVGSVFHANSDDFLGRPEPQSTGYMNMIFEK